VPDDAWEGEATKSKVRLLLIAGGMVGAAVAGLVLVLALTSGGSARKAPRPRALPEEEPAEVARRREPRTAQPEEHAPATAPKGRRADNEEEEVPKPQAQKPTIPADTSTELKQSPPVLSTAKSEQPTTGEAPPKPTSPIPPPPPDEPVEDDKALAQVSGWLKQLDRSLPPETRIAALEALSKLGPRVKDVAGKAIAEHLLDRNTTVGRKAKAALEKIDPAVAEECTAIIVDKDHRLQSIETLAKLGREAKSATPILLWVVDSRAAGSDPKKPSDVIAPAIRALVAVAPDDERLPHRFVTWISSAEEDVRLAVVTGFPKLERLSKKGKQDAITTLAKVLKVADSAKMRAAAADALGEFGPDAITAERTLEAATADSNEEVRRSAQRALRKIRGER
jgi:HEAT repeat protein